MALDAVAQFILGIGARSGSVDSRWLTKVISSGEAHAAPSWLVGIGEVGSDDFRAVRPEIRLALAGCGFGQPDVRDATTVLTSLLSGAQPEDSLHATVFLAAISYIKNSALVALQGVLPSFEETQLRPMRPATEHVHTKQRVFISYSRDSESHTQRVIALADKLRREGVIVELDQYVANPAEGWPLWARRQLEESRFVLIVCTPSYRRHFERADGSSVDKAVGWEALIAEQLLYDAGSSNDKLIPILFEEGEEEHIPLSLRSFTQYRLPTGYDDLYRRLTNQPKVVPPAIGPIRPMPPINGLATALDTTPTITSPPGDSVRPVQEKAPLSMPDGRPPVVLLAFANDRAPQGRTLRNLPGERRAIQRQLSSCAELKVLSDTLLEEVWEAFRDASVQGRIQVFHFAGHASGSWLAFESEVGAPIRAHAEGLAGFLGRQEGLVLVFLNGCSTAAQVQRLRRRVRAVVATTDAIIDEVAAELAGQFYAGLRTKPLEQAFLDAVDFMKSKYSNDSRSVVRRELVQDVDECVPWPWILECDHACKGWRLGEIPPHRDA